MRNLFVWLFVLSLTSAFGQEKKKTWKQVWADEFNSTELDTMYWNFELGDGCPNLCGWGNAERQLYTKTNHSLKDGMLYIRAKKENNIYTASRITTQNKFEFTYGKVEIRAKLPVGKGVWPAIWMLGANITERGWPMCGEIDILEYVGKEPHMVFNSLHTKDSHGNTINTKKTKIEDIEQGFHTYTANWTPDNIEFFVDNTLMYNFAPTKKTPAVWPFDQPFFFILNMAIGGNFGGPEVDDSIFPQEFIIDYIRVYKND